MEGEELMYYMQDKKKNAEKEEWANWGINAIEAATAIFGKSNVRAYTGGIPRVWCSSGSSADKGKVKDLLYPAKVFPDGVAELRLRNM